VWCCKSDHAGERIALGCEDGSVRLFDVTPEGLTYSKVNSAVPPSLPSIVSFRWRADKIHTGARGSAGASALLGVDPRRRELVLWGFGQHHSALEGACVSPQRTTCA
jgi:hypothetical protein